jgi:hypothetical protein
MANEDLPVITKRCVCKLEVCILPSFTCLQYPPPPIPQQPLVGQSLLIEVSLSQIHHTR